MPTRRFVLPALAVTALVAAGCGSNTNSSPDGSAIDGNPSTPLPSTLAAAATASSGPSGPKSVTLKPVSANLSQKPAIPKTPGKPPTDLQIKDIVKGTGAAAADGKQLTVQYVGHNWDNNSEFDTSWGKQPFTFTLGRGMVIGGWDAGLKGMKVGGRRELVIPPGLAYGAQGSPPKIPGNETLVFVIDLKKVK